MPTHAPRLLVSLLCASPLAFGQAPTITSLVPISVVAAGPAFTLTVNGFGFDPTCQVEWAGPINVSGAMPSSNLLTTTFVSATQLTAAVPASLIANPGSLSILVESFNTSNRLSGTLALTMTVPQPVITSLSEYSVNAGSPGTSVTIQGTGLISTSAAYWNDVALATGYQTTTPPSLLAAVPASLLATGGSATITVVNPGNLTPSGGIDFTIAPVSAPTTVTSITPNVVAFGGPDLTVTINGSGFAPGAVAYAQGTSPGSIWTNFVTTFVSGTRLTAVLPAWITAGPIQFQIYVNSGGVIAGGPIFTVTGLTPVITSAGLSPASPQYELTIHGSNFVSAAVVNWAGTPLPTSSFGQFLLSASVPDSLRIVGAWGVTVTNPGGGTSNALTIDIPPVISSITPSAAALGSPSLTISVAGSGFRSGAVVYLAGSGDPVVLATTVVSSTALSAVAPASLLAAAGTYNLYVLDTSGAQSSPVTLAVGPAPILSSISPVSTDGGASVLLTVKGNGFNSGCVVEANGAALSTNYSNSSLMTATVPPAGLANPGTVAITVACGGITSNSVALTVRGPSIGAISPIRLWNCGTRPHGLLPAWRGEYLGGPTARSNDHSGERRTHLGHHWRDRTWRVDLDLRNQHRHHSHHLDRQ